MEKDISYKFEGNKRWGIISNKIDFKTKATVRDKEGHYIMIKEKIQQENINLVNIYAPNTGALKYVNKSWWT